LVQENYQEEKACDKRNNNNNNNNNNIGMPHTGKKQYIKRHDRVCAQLHFSICKETGVQLDKKHWYKHVPKSV
jgi:hypothetical protein